MAPLILCSIVGLTMTIEMTIALRRRSIIPSKLVEELEAMTSPQDAPRVLERFEKINCPLANVIKVGLLNRSLPRLENQEEITLAGRQEAHRLERGLVALEIIAAIAPLLGLLGTVLGMVQVFDVVSKVGVGQASLLSAGIKKALYTTVVGLIVAIPCLVAFSCFSKRVDDLVLEIERYATLLLNKLYSPSAGQKRPAPERAQRGKP
ncbi:MAG: MotA/TolQ/ExbB proton channel family protein [Planctomycetes bacterium]|nr:MotA/TolQ/ExbB proton channel family protein [Planctomycetota bacterium]